MNGWMEGRTEVAKMPLRNLEERDNVRKCQRNIRIQSVGDGFRGRVVTNSPDIDEQPKTNSTITDSRDLHVFSTCSPYASAAYVYAWPEYCSYYNSFVKNDQLGESSC